MEELDVKSKRTVRTNFFILPILSILLVGALTLILFSIFGGRIDYKDYEAVAKGYIEAVYAADIKGLLDLLPKEVADYRVSESHSSEKEFINECSKDYKAVLGVYSERLGKNWKLTYEIKSITQADKDDFDYISKKYQRTFQLNVTEVKEVEYEFRLKGILGRTLDGDEHITLIRIGDKWYVDYSSISLNA